jgi:hypothetical protein
MSCHRNRTRLDVLYRLHRRRDGAASGCLSVCPVPPHLELRDLLDGRPHGGLPPHELRVGHGILDRQAASVRGTCGGRLQLLEVRRRLNRRPVHGLVFRGAGHPRRSTGRTLCSRIGQHSRAAPALALAHVDDTARPSAPGAEACRRPLSACLPACPSIPSVTAPCCPR